MGFKLKFRLAEPTLPLLDPRLLNQIKGFSTPKQEEIHQCRIILTAGKGTSAPRLNVTNLEICRHASVAKGEIASINQY